MKTIVNQTEISWEEAGSGPVLLLVHGLPFQRSMWKPQLAGLSKRFRVIALDLPGHGLSSHRGAGGTYMWVDPVNDLFVVYMMQSPKQRTPHRAALRELVYGAVTDAKVTAAK